MMLGNTLSKADRASAINGVQLMRNYKHAHKSLKERWFKSVLCGLAEIHQQSTSMVVSWAEINVKAHVVGG